MIKSSADVELMAESGRLLASMFTHLDGLPLAGMSTLEINDRVEAFIVDQLNARPARATTATLIQAGTMARAGNIWIKTSPPEGWLRFC